MTMKLRKYGMLIVSAVLLVAIAFAGVASAVAEDGADDANKKPKFVWVDDPEYGTYHYANLKDAYKNVSNPGTIYLNKSIIDISKNLTIRTGVTIKANDSANPAELRLTKDITGSKSEYPLLILTTTSKDVKSPIKLENVIINFDDHYGNILISDYNRSAPQKQPVVLTNVTLKGMKTTITEKQTSLYAAIHICGANVTMTNVTIEPPAESLIGRWICMMDLEARDASEGYKPSILTIDSMPYGAYSKALSTKQATIYQKTTGGSVAKVDPIEIPLLFGETLNVWPGFGKTRDVDSWSDLATETAVAEFGEVINLTNDITSTSSPQYIDIKAGLVFDTSRSDSTYPFTINLASADNYLVVHDLLTLASLLGYSQVTYGEGYIKTGEELKIGDLAKLPANTKIWIERCQSPTEKNNITVSLPGEAIVPVDEYGLVNIRENKNITVKGSGTIKFTDDPRGNASSLWVNGTLNLYTKVTQWPSLGINGTGTVNILNPESSTPEKMPEAMKDNLTVAPITVSGSGNGEILDTAGNIVDPNNVTVKYNSTATLSEYNTNLTITDNKEGASVSYILSPNTGYTGQWVEVKTPKSVTSNDKESTVVAGQFKAVFTKNSQPTPYTPTHKESGQTQILQEGQVAPTQVPTATPTPTAKPTVQPIENPTVKPTTTQTQKSPAPFAGIIAGLGAALLLARMRK